MSSIGFAQILVSMGLISFIAILLVSFLEFFAAKCCQKLLILKVGLLSLLISPIAAFSLSRSFIPKKVIELTSSSFSLQVGHLSAWQSAGKQIDWFWIGALVYMVSVGFLLLRILCAYLASMQMLKDSKSIFVSGHVVWINKNITSPLSFGIFKRRVFFPEDIECSLTKREFALALAHEYAHIERRDPLWKLISLIVRSLLFFMPWSYHFHNKLLFEMEALCDETAREFTKSSVEEYGCFLLAMAARRSSSLVFTGFTGSILKRRITAMKKSTTSRPVLTLLICSSLILLNSVAIAMVSRPLSLNNKFDVKAEVFVDDQLISSPRVVAVEGEQALIEIVSKDKTEVFRFSFIPSLISREKIKLAFEINNISPRRSFSVKPSIDLSPNQEGVLRVITDSGKVLLLRIMASIEAVDSIVRPPKQLTQTN